VGGSILSGKIDVFFGSRHCGQEDIRIFIPVCRGMDQLDAEAFILRILEGKYKVEGIWFAACEISFKDVLDLLNKPVLDVYEINFWRDYFTDEELEEIILKSVQPEIREWAQGEDARRNFTPRHMS